MLMNFNTEIEVKKKFENYGIQIVKGKERLSVMGNYEKGLYIELSSLTVALDVSMNKFLEEIEYIPTIRGYLAHYRESNRIFKVANLECLNLLIRCLASAGYDIELLKTIKEQVNKTVGQFEKEVIGNGKN
jgi:hypothetical protein